MPALAMPAAKATACDSQMPMSKKRSGKSVRTFSSLLPWHMAAVMTETRGSLLHHVVDGGADGIGIGSEPPRFSDRMAPVRPDLLEDGRRVVGHRVVAGLRHAVALLSQDVQQDRARIVP